MSDIKLNIETRRYKLRGLTPILGGQPADPAVRTQYISSRAPSPALGAEEDELLGGIEEKGLTVFMRDEDNRLLLMDYMLKGFFKSALSAIKAQVDVAQERAKVDKFLFIAPRRIPLRRNGAYITDEDDQLERPRRASTMKGERVALAASEMVEDPWSLAFEVTLLPNNATAKSKALTWDVVEMALDYGRYCGLGQWRNGGYGRFVWKRIEDKEEAHE